MADELERPRQTYRCATAGCEGEATGKGRNAYCFECQIKRGTRRDDGTVINGRIPTALGSRTRGASAGECGPFELAALRLVEAGRVLDDALDRYKRAKADVPIAAQAWQRALNVLPRSASAEDTEAVR